MDGEWYPRERVFNGWLERSCGSWAELYLPFLVANAEACATGLERFDIEVWGLPYALAPFKYQVKCLDQLRNKFAALDVADRDARQPIRAHTGYWGPLVAK